MYLARSVHKPRYIGIRELGTLKGQIPTMHKLIEKLKGKEKIQKVCGAFCL